MFWHMNEKYTGIQFLGKTLYHDYITTQNESMNDWMNGLIMLQNTIPWDRFKRKQKHLDEWKTISESTDYPRSFK